jgi:hypothetical protein
MKFPFFLVAASRLALLLHHLLSSLSSSGRFMRFHSPIQPVDFVLYFHLCICIYIRGIKQVNTNAFTLLPSSQNNPAKNSALLLPINASPQSCPYLGRAHSNQTDPAAYPPPSAAAAAAAA